MFIRDEDDNETRLEIVHKALNYRAVYFIGEVLAMASKGYSLMRRLSGDYLYNWISKCLVEEVYLVLTKHLLQVGIPFD